MEVVCNTVQIRFPEGASPPSWVEIAEFTKRLRSNPMSMEVVYKLPQQRSICIKYKSLEAMEETLRQNQEILKFNYADGKIVDVFMSIAGKRISYVRIFDLPPEVPDDMLSVMFAEYGKVRTITREKFPSGLGLDHLYTGVRGAFIAIEKEIPPSMEVNGWKARIFYEGLKGKCFLCNLEGHHRDACPQRKTRKIKEKKMAGKTYAGVVECGEPDFQDDVQFIEEEIIEETVVQSAEGHTTVQLQLEQQKKEQEEFERKGRQEKALAELAKMVNIANTAMDKHQANERRAQFAAAGSMSTEVLHPKKTARKS